MKKNIFLLIILLFICISVFPRKNKHIAVKSTNQINVNATKNIEYEKHLLYRMDTTTSPNGMYRIDPLNGNYEDKNTYYQLFITNLRTNEMRRFYAGDFRTSGWEWTPDDKVEITYNCGTGCEGIKVMNIDETFLLSDEKNGQMSEENGWKFENYSPFADRSAIIEN